MKVPILYEEKQYSLGYPVYLYWCLGDGESANIAIAGSTGTGKTYLCQSILAKLYLEAESSNTTLDFLLADFKGDPSYKFLEYDKSPRYFVFEDVIIAIELFFEKFKKQQMSRDYASIENQISLLVIDEYMSLLAYMETKERNEIQKKISILLNMGRAYGFYIMFVQQRLDAKLFDISRDNLSYIITMGNCSKEVSHMLYSAYTDEIKDDRGVGTGYYLHNGVFRKVISPRAQSRKRVEMCIQQLVSVPLI